MTVERIAQLEASINFIKEKVAQLLSKVQASDLARSTLESRFSTLEAKIVGWAHVGTKKQKENLGQFQSQLSSSQVFASSLKKVDANATSNLTKLQEYFGQLILQSHSKFSEVEEKMLGMLNQKQKILRNINFQLENHKNSIAAIEEWLKTDHNHTNAVHLVEENIRHKVDLMQKNHDSKIEVLQEQIKYFEQQKQITDRKLKTIEQSQGKKQEEMQKTAKQLRKEMEDLTQEVKQHKPKEQGSQSFSRELKSVKEEMEKLRSKLRRQEDEINDINYNHNKLAKKVTSIQEKSNTLEYNNSGVSAKEFVQQQRANSSASERKQNYTSVANKKPMFQEHSSHIPLSNIAKQSKKELPPRKGLFGQTSPQQDPGLMSGGGMRGGVRGLLQKSKEKERQQQQHRHEDRLGSRSGSRKGLPPVRQDPLSRRKKEKVMQVQAEQDEAVVYQIDEEGYLMDEAGNYLLDQHGNMIKLSPEEIQEYGQEVEY